jgi:hypothetical protein
VTNWLKKDKGKFMTIEIVEVMRRSDQGMTRPFICRADNGKTYFVKGRDAGRRSQICEWIAGCLARQLKLPIAPFEIVNVPEELLNLSLELDLSELGAGPAFASLEQQVTELTITGMEHIPPKLQQDVWMFDWWIKNGDRSLTERGGNPNLFWEPSKKELVVIDHNMAFDMSTEPDDFFKFHVFSDQANLLASDINYQQEYNGKFQFALKAWSDILREVPEPWWYLDAEMTVPVDFSTDAVYELLMRYQHNDFWSWK